MSILGSSLNNNNNQVLLLLIRDSLLLLTKVDSMGMGIMGGMVLTEVGIMRELEDTVKVREVKGDKKKEGLIRSSVILSLSKLIYCVSLSTIQLGCSRGLASHWLWIRSASDLSCETDNVSNFFVSSIALYTNLLQLETRL